jgi:hypothetical protein
MNRNSSLNKLGSNSNFNNNNNNNNNQFIIKSR